MRWLPGKLRRWYGDPFATKVYYHERTRIECRRFPHKLRVTAVESLQEQLDRSGEAVGNGGVYWLTRPLVLRGAERLVKLHLVGKGQPSSLIHVIPEEADRD